MFKAALDAVGESLNAACMLSRGLDELAASDVSVRALCPPACSRRYSLLGAQIDGKAEKAEDVNFVFVPFPLLCIQRLAVMHSDAVPVGLHATTYALVEIRRYYQLSHVLRATDAFL